jgi:hypothetical protein
MCGVTEGPYFIAYDHDAFTTLKKGAGVRRLSVT